MNKTLLHTANGTTIALELKGYGISVVYEEVSRQVASA